MTPESTGSLCVLNVGAGDIEVVFNQHDTGEVAKALRMLKDMQSRGYAILVRDADGNYTRVVEIDATRGRYVVMLPEEASMPPDAELVTTQVRGRRRRGRRKISVPIQRRHAVGVARSAGG